MKKTIVEKPEDLTKSTAVDLQTPSNIQTNVEFDPKTNRYVFRNIIGNTVIDEPFSMTPDEYTRYRVRMATQNYFKEKNAFNHQTKQKENEPLSFSSLRKSNNILGEIFGPGGVQFNARGSIDLTTGIKRTVTDNPVLPEHSRKRTMLDFDQNIQLNADVKVGDKINFGINYDTEAMFDFDAKRIKLAYDGKEDEILKHIEAGNVSMTTSNSLINGGAALFGIKADLQFGKLHVNTVFSQQNSEAKTVSSQGGVQTTPFEFGADQYDENRHFFLGYFFRNQFDKAMSKAPYIQSAVSITRIEVWITNKKGNYDQARNIVAFADLAEHSTIHNPLWMAQGSIDIPSNDANTLYGQMISSYMGARDISMVANVLPAQMMIGRDYEKIENARLLTASEYTLQPQLGYISLRTALQSDEVLAVAYEYTYNGKVYQVGEFSNNVGRETNGGTSATNGALFLKLLKPISFSPQSYTWPLMMKNIYTIDYGAKNILADRFRMNILYQSDTTGVYLNYIPDGNIKNKLLLQVMNLDRLNSKGNPYPDGQFDYLEGYTVSSANGQIIFPVVEPFGSHFRQMIGDDAIAKKYVYQELYDSTLTVARQIAEKNKFRMSGEYRGTSGSGISLNAMNVQPGTVKVIAAGNTLTEGVDYTVDYVSGSVNILNQAILDAGTPLSVSVENQSMFSMQRKTLIGTNLLYDFSKNFSLGATIMHLSEKPLTMKTNFGEEAVNNTLWGLNASLRKESYVITNLLDKLPFVEAVAPSQITANAEFAQILPGHYTNPYTGSYSYLDDFETSTSNIDLHSPYAWTLASTPFNNTSTGLFPEASLSNNIDYGKNRAQLAWFYIDGIFTRKNSSLTPPHLKKDLDQLSNHLVREVYEREIYPNRETAYGDPPTIPVLNVSFYPNERGPYNLDTNIDANGYLLNPYKRWGGIMRKLDVRDFESANIGYIEFWLMDPFVNDTLKTSKGGDLYFNLGEISEDVLKDGKKFYENGLPLTNDETAVEETVWGKVPKKQSTVYAFDNSQGSDLRKIQDVGLNGLSSEEEKLFPTYSDYLQQIQSKVSSSALEAMKADPMSPLNTPSGDKFMPYRCTEQDEKKSSILNRYKYYNGTEGNSLAPYEGQNYATASRTTPDVEDIDGDNTMNENESYYQYKVRLRPQDMQVGSNYIVDKRETTVRLRNGQDGKVTWYQFKIPISDYQTKVGSIQGFKTIRFMRMFLTGFDEPTFLRIATLDLVRSEWRNYTQNLLTGGSETGMGQLEISTVNIEENGDRTPVNYVLPPGVTRILDPSQPQLRQENEQSISLKIKYLEPNDSRSVYKNTILDLRRYKRLQMFVHGEKMADASEDLFDGDFTVFLRIGSDYRQNYYEYEIPLHITPPGKYNSRNLSDQKAVWIPDNMFDFPLEALTNLKLKRNFEKGENSNVTYLTPYSESDPDKTENTITIMGNPSLAEVKVMMIGVRNKSNSTKSGEIWIDELRLSEFDEKGGWAAQGNMNIALSDIGTVNVQGRKETSGFGALDQSLLERRNNDYSEWNIALNLDLGRFLPKEVKLIAPFYYSYSNQTSIPQYDPFNQDITMKKSINSLHTNQQKDSLKTISIDKTTNKSISISNVRIDIKSKTPMPYDPANFSFGYSQNISTLRNPETEYFSAQDTKLQANYFYNSVVKSWEPFDDIKSNLGWLKLIKSLNFNYIPNSIQASSTLSRNYQETQLRDVNAYLAGNTQTQKEYLSFSQNFFWNRDFSILWNLTKNLGFNFRSGTIAEIEEPYLQVNKKINRPDYEIWKDSVMQSIRSLGKPYNYQQTANVTYTIPFSQIPILDWINTSAVYDSHYQWERGTQVEGEQLGNILQNDLSLTLNSRFNMVSLYGKIPFLKKTNQRFEARPAIRQNQPDQSQKKSEQKYYEKTIVLNQDSGVIITHDLMTKKLNISAQKDGKSFPLSYKYIDNSRIRITSKDTAEIMIKIVSKPEVEPSRTLYDIAQYAARGLMMIRNINLNLAYKTRTDIYGFKPMIGDAFGQKPENDEFVPGLPFAFGFEGGTQFIDKAKQKNWLVTDENNIQPALYNETKNFRTEADIEPFRGLKITLEALYEDNRRTEIRYMYNDMPNIHGGTFAISTISLASAFEKFSAKDNYHSKSFDRFLANRDVIASRIREKYQSSTYPGTGFLSGNGLAGQPFDPVNGDVNQNSADVLIPAFLAAYTGKKTSGIALTAFPDLRSTLPNWSITYNAINGFPMLRENFKSLTLYHKYSSQYRVGNYSSFINWVATPEDDDLGYIRDAVSGAPLPSSPYDISHASLIESFNPLLEIRSVFYNNMSLSIRYNRTRTLNLNIPSYQIVETGDNDVVLGFGYRIPDFNRLLGIKLNTQKNDDRRRRSSLNAKDDPSKIEADNLRSSFNNDLNIRFDLSNKITRALIRTIEDGLTQATGGLRTVTLQFSADYSLSRSLTLKAFFDKTILSPLVSATSYPTSTTSTGISLKFNLNQ
ncbi:T9SS outer membrane translocon Sov/SprA [Seramator thermalis]|uniref:T9SS outer membrane translocon Sov/SprA n=1 Tax=Seramator thermalis TaxID=2496270 RepID=UPI001EEEE529|nr:cell surface protein SprA [Seramator thermalis]